MPPIIRLTPSIFSLNTSILRSNRSVFRLIPGEIHHKLFSTDSGEDASFDESCAGIEPRPSFLDIKERMRDMHSRLRKIVSRFQNQLAKIEHRFDARFDRLERSMERWLFKFLGLVSYSHYSYSTAFSKNI